MLSSWAWEELLFWKEDWGQAMSVDGQLTMSKIISKTRFWSFILITIFLLSCTPKPSTTKSKWQGMDQSAFVEFPELGVLEIGVRAVNKQLPKLIIRNTAKKILFQVEMGHSYSDPGNFLYSAGIEFKVSHIPGLPDPLLMVLAVGSGGSANRWEMMLIGVVSGRIQRLWRTKPFSDAGGFFVGDLGKGRGLGIAEWDWSPWQFSTTKYSIQLYRWNKGKAQFDLGPHFILKDDEIDNLGKLGLEFPDQKGDFKHIEDKWWGRS
jgi:hypothetical protein